MLPRAIVKSSTSSSTDTSLTAEIKSFGEDLFVRAKRTASLDNNMLTRLILSDGTSKYVIEEVTVRMLSFHDVDSRWAAGDVPIFGCHHIQLLFCVQAVSLSFADSSSLFSTGIC